MCRHLANNSGESDCFASEMNDAERKTANKKRMTIFDLAAGHGKKNFLDGNRKKKKKLPGFVPWVCFHVRDTGYFHPLFFKGPCVLFLLARWEKRRGQMFICVPPRF